MGIFNPFRKMSFNEEQKKLLNQKINKDNVSFRSGGGGQQLAYVESWHVIKEANRIFGFDGWSSETLETSLVSEDSKCVSYIAKVRITVGNVIREGTGAGHGRMGGIGDKHESAIKEAESDARKRCLMQFGDSFGLSLYDKDKAWLRPDDSKSTISSNQPIDRSESDKFIKECEAFINKPGNKDKLGLLKKNISKRYETNAISENQRDGLLTLILEKEDA
jgi:DNA repair and recombination protein RAD52